MLPPTYRGVTRTYCTRYVVPWIAGVPGRRWRRALFSVAAHCTAPHCAALHGAFFSTVLRSGPRERPSTHWQKQFTSPTSSNSLLSPHAALPNARTACALVSLDRQVIQDSKSEAGNSSPLFSPPPLDSATLFLLASPASRLSSWVGPPSGNSPQQSRAVLSEAREPRTAGLADVPVRCTIATIMDDGSRGPAERAHPSRSSAPAAVPPPPDAEDGSNGTGQQPPRPGHELPFVAPSSYLRPKPASRTMSERSPSALDKEQMQGLVSNALPPALSPLSPSVPRQSRPLSLPAAEPCCVAGSPPPPPPPDPTRGRDAGFRPMSLFSAHPVRDS